MGILNWMTRLPWSLEKLLGTVISSKQFYFFEVNLLLQSLDLLLHLSFHLYQLRPLGRRHGITKSTLPKRDDKRHINNVSSFVSACDIIRFNIAARGENLKPKHDLIIRVSNFVRLSNGFLIYSRSSSTNLTEICSKSRVFLEMSNKLFFEPSSIKFTVLSKSCIAQPTNWKG